MVEETHKIIDKNPRTKEKNPKVTDVLNLLPLEKGDCRRAKYTGEKTS